MTRHTFLGRLEDVAAQARYRGVITSNAAYRRRVLLEVGGFDETLLCGEDWDLAWRVRDAGYEVIHDRRPVVTHDPPELRANALRFLGKEMWYGRHDVPAHLRAVLRALREPASCSGSRAALDAVGDSAVNVFCLAALVGGAAAASPALVGLGMGAAAIRASREVLAARKVEPLRPTHASRAVALQTARVFARGAGTVTGYVDLAAGAARSALARPGRDADASTTSLPSAKAAPSPPTAP